MAWTYNGTGSQTLIADGSHLDIPDSDWAIAGWLRIASNNHSDYRRIFTWGTPGGTPHVQVFLAGDGLGVSNADRLCARVIDASGNDSSILWSSSFALDSHTDKWIAWTLTHDDSGNTTYFRVLDRATSTYYTASASHNCGSINIAEGLYIGSDNTINDSRRFQGDMADFIFLPGLHFDVNNWHGYIHGSMQGYRWPDRSLHIPMLSDRADEEWVSQASLTSTNVSTTTNFDNPQGSRILQPMYKEVQNELASTGSPATEGLRLMQFYNQVVATPDQSTACLTVARLYADVLVSDVGTGPVTHNESINQSMNLSQEALGSFDIQEIAHTLSLNSTASAVKDIHKTTISLMSLASLGGRSFTYSTNSPLGIIHTMNAFNYVADRDPCGNVMVLTQCVEEKSSRFIDHDLGLVQTVNVQAPIKPHVIQPLGITQHVSTPWRFWVSDFMYLTQHIGLVLPTQHVTDTINFVQDSPIGRVDQSLNLTQNVFFAYSHAVSHNVGITDSVNLQANFIRSVTHNGIIGHSLTWLEDSPCDRKQYTPFQGENTIPSVFTPPSVDLQDPQGDTGNFSVYTPYLGVPTSKVTLRKPELDNRDRNAYTRVNNESRGGKLIVYSDPQWPHVRTLAVTIIGLTEADVDSFQAFTKATLGQEIGLTDWEGRLWKGVITNPNEPATQDGRNMWTVTFEFEGEMLDVEQPGNDDGNGMAMNLTQSVTAVIV